MEKIIVIDDDDKVRRMLRKLFESEGYIVYDAPDGNKGIMLQRQINADLVISDIFMPEKEGIETILELKHDYPDLKIIAMSGGGRISPQNYLRLARKCGAIQAFQKPIRNQDLMQMIRQVLAKEV